MNKLIGYLLSVLCNKPNTISAGASAMIFGVIGTYLAFMTINWQTLSFNKDIRSQLCCTIGILVFFSLLFSLGSDIDLYGHLGGMIGGYFMALAILPGMQNKKKIFMMAGAGGLAGYLVLITILFFFVV
jgi:rhomboid protease GluP